MMRLMVLLGMGRRSTRYSAKASTTRTMIRKMMIDIDNLPTASSAPNRIPLNVPLLPEPLGAVCAFGEKRLGHE